MNFRYPINPPGPALLAVLKSTLSALALLAAMGSQAAIDREAVVNKFSPELQTLQKDSPMPLGNGKFAFTADVTGFQSFGPQYYAAGFPLETKARWAWHTKSGESHTLAETEMEYDAYGRKVVLPTVMDGGAAQWLQQNPHDLPLGRIALLLDGKALQEGDISAVDQRLNLWEGNLSSRYSLAGEEVQVDSAVDADRDAVGFEIKSKLNKDSRLSFEFRFPRAYDFSVENTPDMDWQHDGEHTSTIASQNKSRVVLQRKVDDEEYLVVINWDGEATLENPAPHTFVLKPGADEGKSFSFTVEYIAKGATPGKALSVGDLTSSAKKAWKTYWKSGAFVDVSASKDPSAKELQRRIILSQYLEGAESRARLPTQEGGLSSSSWSGKFHTDMAWWQYAHWILWDKSKYARPMLDWYLQHLDQARTRAEQRGLQGARWPTLVGPEGRESPGTNALTIWNQPQAIHLAEILYQQTQDNAVLEKYASLVDETARAMSSMLVWDNDNNRFVLDPPIWISQEIYEPKQSRNPAFELSYWRYALEVAQRWRSRRSLPIVPEWQTQLNLLAPLPIKDGKYVAMESIPDTFDNPGSRVSHPTMLAATAIFDDREVDTRTMSKTLDAVVSEWDFDNNIRGWDYPMMAMTAARLHRPDLALQLLLKDSTNNHYLNNGYCPQQGENLPNYLPANAALLTAVAVMLQQDPQTGKYLGFPDTKAWKIRAEGF